MFNTRQKKKTTWWLQRWSLSSTNQKVGRSIPEPRVAVDPSIECVCEYYTTCLTKCFYFWVNESKKHFEFSVRAQKHDTSSSPLKEA